MREAKYIVWDDDFPQAVIFSDTITHFDMARALSMGNVLGAGFCRTESDRYICYGESISLRKLSRGEQDEKILDKWFAGASK